MIVVNSSFLALKLRGINRFAIEISKELKHLLGDIKFIAPENILKNQYTEEIQPEIYKNKIRIPAKQVVFWEQMELVSYLKKHNNPLLVNLTNTAPAFYKNQIVTIHDLMFLQNPSWYSKKHYYFYKNLFYRVAHNSLKVVTVSDFSKKEIIKYFKVPENKIEVVHNAVSSEFIKLADDDFQNKYGDYILAVSSLDPRKNFVGLVHAFNKLKLKDVKLLIVGEEGTIFKQQSFKNIMQDNPNIIFTGFVTDKELAGLYKNAKLFVFPSFYEGFGIPPLEAMACGSPTIVANAASIPEVCADASYYVNPADINSIADGIYEVIKNEALQIELRNKGFERIKAFSWQNSAKKYVDIIQNLT